MAALAQTPNALQVTSDRIDLSSITDGANPRGIPQVAFIEDIETFAKKSNPPASAEFLIGAFSDLFSKFKLYETNLARKRMNYQVKLGGGFLKFCCFNCCCLLCLRSLRS